jgi:CheY-like chemotaxis protein
MGLGIKIDTTPCLIDAHFNDEILIIDLARGINSEKVDLLKFKIEEILKLYGVLLPKVLVIMTDIELQTHDGGKLSGFLTTIRETTNTPLKGIKILTTSESVRRVLKSLEEYKTIEVTNDIAKAMDRLLGVKVSEWIDEGLSVVREDFFKSRNPAAGKETIDLKFDHEKVQEGQAVGPPNARQIAADIAVVDDDPVIRELVKTTFMSSNYSVTGYENGKVFIDQIEKQMPNLVYLDLKMPEMDGFAVLQRMREQKIDVPVIILSAFTQRETVIKALQYGVKSYLGKPLKPADILTKTEEVLGLKI